MCIHVSNHLFMDTPRYCRVRPSAELSHDLDHQNFRNERSQEDIEWLQEIIEQDEAEEVQFLGEQFNLVCFFISGSLNGTHFPGGTNNAEVIWWSSSKNLVALLGAGVIISWPLVLQVVFFAFACLGFLTPQLWGCDHFFVAKKMLFVNPNCVSSYGFWCDFSLEDLKQPDLTSPPPGRLRFFQLRDSYPVTKRCCISSKDVHQGFMKSSVPKDFWTNWVGNIYKSKFGTRINSLVVFFFGVGFLLWV